MTQLGTEIPPSDASESSAPSRTTPTSRPTAAAERAANTEPVRAPATAAASTAHGAAGHVTASERVHAAEHRLGALLESRLNRILVGVAIGLCGLLLKLVINTASGADTGFVSYYLAVAASAAIGGIAAGLTATAVVAGGQILLFYEPIGTLLISNTANMLRLGLFSISGALVTVIANGLLRARLRAEAAGLELEHLYAAEAAARVRAEEAGRRTQSLFETAAGLSDALTAVDVAATVIRQAVLDLGSIGGAVHLVSEDGTMLELLRGDGYPADVLAAYRSVPLDGDTAIAAIARTGDPLYLVDRTEIERRFPASLVRARVSGEQAFAGLPVSADNRTIAVISIGFNGPRTFSPEERDFHATLAQQTGQALERARLYEAERRGREAAERAEELAATLQAITTALAPRLEPLDVARVVTEQAIAAFGSTVGGLILVDEDGRTARPFGASEAWLAAFGAEQQFDVDDPRPAAEALRTGQPVFCGSPDAIDRDFPKATLTHGGQPVQAVAALPFDVDAANRGEVLLWYAEPRSFSADERTALAGVAKEVGHALLRARLYAAEQRSRAEAEESRGALAFVAEASRVLAASLDYEATLQRVADLTVPSLADWCAMDMVQPGGSVRAVAIAHIDKDGRALLREYRDRFPPDAVQRGSASVIASGEPLLIPALHDEAIDRTAPNPEIADYARRLQIRSYLSVPLAAPDGPLGAITFASSTPGRYGPAELAIAQDLAQRAADAIRRAELFREARQFVATVDATLDAVFMFEPESLRLTYVNQGAMNQVGYARDELLGRSALDIKPDFDEAGYRELIAPLLTGERPAITFTTTHLHRDGTRVPVEVFLQAVRLPGDQIQMIITSRDIRQQIEVEANLYRLARAERARAAELSAVIRGMGEGVLVCDPEGRVILSNPAAGAILGSTVERYDDLLAIVDAPPEDVPQLASAGGPVEVRLLAADRWIDLSTYPVSLDPGEPYGEAETTIIVLRDVTAARRARAAREAFIGVMSHELRTPITTIYGTTKLFNRAAESPELMRSMLVDIEAEADRLYRLVEDLLILSRSESGIELEGEPVLLQHVVRSVVAGEAARWPEIRFSAKVPAGLPPVSGDRTHLEQVVRNLLSNAAKYSGPGTDVEVRAETDGDHVSLRVLDSGPGFAGDEAESLFELFYRSPSTAKKAPGAGIGLYVSRALIEAMSGRIWARPRPEGGAEFGFTVPILEAEAEPDDFDEASLTTD
jgi:PAS domain S-box-containing protein